LALEESVKSVGGIRFAVLSPSEIRKYSVAEITAPETYDEDGMPVQGGLMDNRLGTLEPGQKCGTCGNTATRCPGHFGHVELAEPVIHIAFVDDVHKLLTATCRACGRLLLSEEDIGAYRHRLAQRTPFTPTLTQQIAREILSKVKKTKQCFHCGKNQYEIEFTKPSVFHEITEGGGATRLLPVAIRERLERIPNEDLELLGYEPASARPEWFVLQVLPVPPVAVRPSITLESGIRSEDDLTHKIVDILRVNQRVRESKESGTPPLIVQDLVDLLQYHVTTYFDNEVSGIPQAHHRSGRPLKTLSQRLKGKEGRFRGSLSGKRVDFSSRTVISPDPSLDISEVGVPYEVARKLTIPEKASPWNLDFLKQLISNGPFKHPGANYVIRPDGVKIRLDYVSDLATLATTIAPGFIVERHLMDGDIVIFNRQPSLHRMSVMAHYVRVLPYRTFRLHPAVCPPYNADFDGDEMNLHVPQSEEARSEALTLMRVQDQILSPRYGGPIIGGIRDFLTAAYLLTKDSTVLTKSEFTDLALAGGYAGDLPEPEYKQPPLYTGKQLFSLFLPKGFNYVLESRWAKSQKGGATQPDVRIIDGKLISGVIDRASIGAEESDSILHRIAKDYGTESARTFLNSILRLLKAFITQNGFSYGFDELTLPDDAYSTIEKSLDESYARVKELISQYKEGNLQLTRGLSPEEALEFYVVNELAKARDKAGRIADRALSLDNAGIIMARTGARGSSLNLGQMTAALGQQSVRGKRIEKGYQRRALSHFLQGDTTPDARGFVRSNYRDGLSPTEFFFHAMGGREGLVDTAVRTQQSGYMQRRLVNALEHLRVEYDLTVRDPGGNIIQFRYGEDGVDPAKSDHGKAVNVERLTVTQKLISSPSEKAASASEIGETVRKYAPSLNGRIVEDLTKTLESSELGRTSVEAVCKKVVELLKRATVEPGEASGIVAAQSIGEPGTQMSIASSEGVIVREDGRVRTVKIGEFVDKLMGMYPTTREGDTEWCDIPSGLDIEVPSLESGGKILWKGLRSVSRHRHNRPLIRIRTRSGRTITATDNHSFVRRINGQLVAVRGRELAPGDRLPVLKNLPLRGEPQHEFESIRTPSKQTQSFWAEVGKPDLLGAGRDAGYGLNYEEEVPVKCDGLRSVVLGGRTLSTIVDSGWVYPYRRHQHSKLREILQLEDNNNDNSIGWLMGAYLSEGGYASPNYVSFPNTDEGFVARGQNVARKFAAENLFEGEKGFGGRSHELVFHSSLLSEFFLRTCGKPSEKHVPEVALGASEDFVAMLLRAYFDVDGYFDVKRRGIKATSSSKEVIDGITLLLTRFGISGRKMRERENFALWIPAKFATNFRDRIGSDVDYKKHALELLCRPNVKDGHSPDIVDMTSGFGGILKEVAQKLGIPTRRRIDYLTKRQSIGRSTLAHYIQIFEDRADELGFDISPELTRLKSLLNEDVTWDEVTEIQRVDASDEFVYDFSVPGLETFVTTEGLVTHNTLRTFHFAGVKERDVTLGLPRLIELVDARKQPQTPSMDVYLEEGIRNSNEEALKVAREILFTKVANVVELSEIDYSGKIVLALGKTQMRERDCTPEMIAEVVRTGKRKVEVEGDTVFVSVEGLDLPSLFTLRNKVLNQRVKGIPGITRVTVVKEGDEWVIQTSGSNLSKVLQIPGVDKRRTTTNNIFEIAQTLGIEAARTALVKEVMSTLEEQGLEVDIRHVFLVADLMTSKGFLQQIGRHGVAGTKTSVLARAAFEITVPTLAEAAVSGETEDLKGVTENVIVGLPVPVGTGMIDVFMRS
jgi:DNA-directed RNA polymerase subunit A'